MTTQEIVAKLWNLCNVLRDDGITYHQYVTELTYILFLKMPPKPEMKGVFRRASRLRKGSSRPNRRPKTPKCALSCPILGRRCAGNPAWSSTATTRTFCACSESIARGASGRFIRARRQISTSRKTSPKSFPALTRCADLRVFCGVTTGKRAI